MKICYNCSKPIAEGQKAREHIPAKNLYEGYSIEYKVNRIVVPACLKCNNKYSKLDQEFRDAIGVLNDTNEKQLGLSEKTARSLLRDTTNHDRINIKDGKISVLFNYSKFRELHIKNFKGIFYNKFGEPVPEIYKIEIVADGDEEYENLMSMTQVIYNEMVKYPFLVSGQEEIFKYKIASIYEDKGNISFSLTTFKDSMCVICFQVIHDTLFSLTMAAGKEFTEMLKPNHYEN